MIYVTRFDIFSAINGGYATRVHTKYIFTTHVMTNAEKAALMSAYEKEYGGDDWRVDRIEISCTIIKGGETE